MKNTLKGIGAVLIGFIVVALLSIATDYLLETFGILPPRTNPEEYVTWMLGLALLYRSIYTIVGGYVTAMLAPQNPMKHVKALAILGGIGGVLGVIAGWKFGNHWYPLLLAISGPILVLYGGKLFKGHTPTAV